MMASLDYIRSLEADVLARTIWGEARGEGQTGMAAVAAVVINRVEVAKERGRYWWGSDVIHVCQKPYQFSCWNRNDPNFMKVQNVTAADPVFSQAVEIAVQAVSGILHDPTRGATHYHAEGVEPEWARGKMPTAIIWKHVFYRIV